MPYINYVRITDLRSSFFCSWAERGAVYEVPVVTSRRDWSNQVDFGSCPRRDGAWRRDAFLGYRHRAVFRMRRLLFLLCSVELLTWKTSYLLQLRETGSRGLLSWVWCRTGLAFLCIKCYTLAESVKNHIYDRVIRTDMATFWSVSYSSDMCRAAAPRGRTIVR